MKKFLLLITLIIPLLLSSQKQKPLPIEQLREYILKNILKENTDKIAVWTTDSALDQSHVARSLLKEKEKDIEFPFKKSWLIMIDEMPDANFGHPVKWIFISDDLKQHSEVITKSFPPLVISEKGNGKTLEFKCRPITRFDCARYGFVDIDKVFVPLLLDHSCKFAILVSGGINTPNNHARYPQNIRSMYKKLRSAGFPKSNISVYYASGSIAIDCDNLDSDNNDNTGSDLTGGAIESIIRTRFQNLCASANSCNTVLVSYFSNHGADDDGVCLWDVGNDGLTSGELYSPSELSSDVANCKFKRHFMIHDQCFAGDFVPMATDGNHPNLTVYAAATATEFSWGRQYMARWEQNNLLTTTIDNIHQDVVTNGSMSSTCVKGEAQANNGNWKLGNKCRLWWICFLMDNIFLIAMAIVIIPIMIALIKRMLSK
ncbi:MAG: hypothetical protein HOP11_07890 [Saprospiraceae bacterium]|nr:hypothetical protein [Saprospiraceae bacterium]